MNDELESYDGVENDFSPDNIVESESLWGNNQSMSIVEAPKRNNPEVDEVDFSDLGNEVVVAENAYRQQQMMNQTAPIVDEALARQKDKMRVELHQVLDDEVGHRLDKYEKRRKQRAIQDGIGTLVKLGVVALVLALFLGNAQLRKRAIIVVNDFGDLFHGLINGETVHSNQLVDDLFKDLDEDIDKQDFQEELEKQNETKKKTKESSATTV